ncbi:MAG: phosphoribosylanthranilate isomerase [Thermomicrobiales bacterium]
MIVQIYSLTHPDDVRTLVELDVDHIGVAPAGQGLRSELGHAQVRELFALMPTGTQRLALTVQTEPEPIVAMAEDVRPAIVHICSATDALGVEEQRRLRSLLPEGTRIMKAIEVGGPETAERAIDAAHRFAPVSDFYILDTDDPAIPGIGAAGQVHDWDISARIVELVGEQIPVILAGGLSPENVAEAIRHVRPAGVDSFSWTNTASDSRRKDPELVRAFVQEARRAAAELGL